MHVNNILLTVVDTGRRSGAAREKHHGRMIDMANEKNIKDLFNATAYDRNGDKLGAVKEVFVDDNSGQPTFVEVGHGLFGMSSSLVPMRGHCLSGDELQLAFDKERIKDAPNLDADNHLTPEDQRNIYGHYQLTDAQDSERYLADERRERHADPHHDGRRDGDRDLRDGDRDLPRDAAAGAGVGAAGAGITAGLADDGRAGRDDRGIRDEHGVRDDRDLRDRGQTRPGQVHDRPDHVDSDLSAEELDRRADQRDVDMRDAERTEALDGQAPLKSDDHGPVDRHDTDQRSDLGGAAADRGDHGDAGGQDRDLGGDRGTGEVRLRRHVVTDYETIEVPVTREEIRVERDTVSDRDERDARDIVDPDMHNTRDERGARGLDDEMRDNRDLGDGRDFR